MADNFDIFADNDINSGTSVRNSQIALDNDRITNVADDGGQVITGNSGPVTAGTQGANVAGDDLNQIRAEDSTVLQNSSVDGSLAANNGGIQFAAQDGGELGPVAFGEGSQATSVDHSNLSDSNVGVGGDALVDNSTEENNLTNIKDSEDVNVAQDDSHADAFQDDVAIDDSGNSFEDNDNVVKAFAGEDFDFDA